MSETGARAIRGAAVGFAIGLLLSFLTHCRPEVALGRATIASLLLAAVTLLASALNQHATLDDETPGKRNETAT